MPYRLSDFDPRETSATLRIEDHYQRVGLSEGWAMHRVNRSAGIVGCTLYELGRLALVDFDTMDRYIKKGRVPAPIALHFAICEATRTASTSHRISTDQSPIVPIGLL